jgi:hypothetical protein
MDTFYQSPGSDQRPPNGSRSGVCWYASAVAVLLAVGVIGGVALAGNTTTPAGQAIPAATTGSPRSAHPAGSAGSANSAGSAGW